MRFNASWVMVTWEPILDRMTDKWTDMTEHWWEGNKLSLNKVTSSLIVVRRLYVCATISSILKYYILYYLMQSYSFFWPICISVKGINYS